MSTCVVPRPQRPQYMQSLLIHTSPPIVAWLEIEPMGMGFVSLHPKTVWIGVYLKPFKIFETMEANPRVERSRGKKTRETLVEGRACL